MVGFAGTQVRLLFSPPVLVLHASALLAFSLERWPSGLRHHVGNVTGQRWPQEFESPSLRQVSVVRNAGVAQLVEHYLAMVDVASSSLVPRSMFNLNNSMCAAPVPPAPALARCVSSFNRGVVKRSKTLGFDSSTRRFESFYPCQFNRCASPARNYHRVVSSIGDCTWL